MAQQQGVSVRRLAVGNGQRGIVQAFIEVTDTDVYAQLEELGVTFGYSSGTIATAVLPLDKMDDILAIEGVQRVEFAEEAKTTLDVVRRVSFVDQVHNGVGLDRPYKGKGVIIGTLDTGIDFNHTLFNDTEGNSRILYAYMTSQTTPQAGGKKYTGNGFSLFGDAIPSMTFPGYYYEGDYIKSLTTDKADESHGTHTLGIAAGGSYGHEQYYGMAPEATIIAAGGTLGPTTMINTAAFTFNEAAKRNMPAVATFSIGEYRGSRSGTEIFPRLARTLIGPGRIICVAAGNEGYYKRHLEKPAGTQSVKTTLRAYNSNNILGSDIIDICSNGKKDYTCKISVLNINTGETTELYSDNASKQQYIRNIKNAAYSGYFNVTSEKFKDVGEYGVTITLSDVKMTTLDYCICIEIIGDGEVDMWGAGKSVIFSSANLEGYTSGDSNESTNTLAMFPGCITVGAYNTRNSYTWYGDGKGRTVANTTPGQINRHSGYGIDRTGVAHPTIAAPGAIICSGVNLYHDKYGSSGNYSNMLIDVVNKDGRDNRYAMLQGTSMAAPCAAGIIALWLEANPNLTPDDVKNLFAMTATQDQYTKADPLRFGYGKINAYDGIAKCIETTTSIARVMGQKDCVQPIITKGYQSIRVLVPNTSEQSTVEIATADGHQLIHDTVNGDTPATFPISGAHGLYIIKVKNSASERTVKVVL